MLIGVDHGNKQIKTVHGEPFVSGLQQSLTRPFGQSLQYCGTYYTLSNERIPFHKDKTEDDRFFVLTLIAIAEEITARGIGEKEQQHIQLAVGLPPAHFGSQAEKFTAYFQGRGLVEFMYGDKHYTISIEDVACYPQAYAAAATMLHALLDDPKAVVLDIGGFTADYLLSKTEKPTSLPAIRWKTALSCYTIKSGPEEMQSWICCWMRAMWMPSSWADGHSIRPRLYSLWNDWRRSLSTTCSALYESGCWICAIAKWCLWAAALFCCAGRSRIPARWERLCSSRTSTPMQLDLNTCTGLKQWAGDNHDGQKRKGALLPAVQYR